MNWKFHIVSAIPRSAPNWFMRIPVYAQTQTHAAITGRIVAEVTGARLWDARAFFATGLKEPDDNDD
jgi:hypothetical protein